MSLASRGSRAAARSLRQSTKRQQTRRYASDSHGHDHVHGHGESALHLPDANPKGTEGLGLGAYLTLASIPLFYVGYSLAKGDPNNSINKLFEEYKEGKKETATRDLLHQTAIEQAVVDRAELFSYPRETTPDIRYTEFFNSGSPWNNVAGGSGADMRELQEYTTKVQADAQQQKLARLQKGETSSVYETEPPEIPGLPKGKS